MNEKSVIFFDIHDLACSNVGWFGHSSSIPLQAESFMSVQRTQLTINFDIFLLKNCFGQQTIL